jgi:hypothetical protein
MTPSKIRETELFRELAPEIAELQREIDSRLSQLDALCDPGWFSVVMAAGNISFIHRHDVEEEECDGDF